MQHTLFSLFLDIEFVYLLTISMISFGVIIATLEDIFTWSIFKSSGLLSWKVSKLSYGWSTKGFRAKILDLILNDKSFKFSIYLRLIVSILLFGLSVFKIISPSLLILEFFLMSLICLRNPYSLDGAYQMCLVILFGISLGTLFGIHSTVSIFCLWFIALQLILSYFIAGIAKIFSPIWRKPYALTLIFSTKVYGHSLAYKLVSQNSSVALCLSWGVMLFEILFVVALILPPQFAILFVVAGALFHLGNGIFMGLNDFLFSFSASYPAFLFCMYTKSQII